MKTFIALSAIIAIAASGKVPEQRKVINQQKRSLLEPEAQETTFYQSPYYFPQSESYNDQSQGFDEGESAYQEDYEKQSDDKSARLLNYNHVYDNDKYKIEFESDNGIKTQEEGHKQGKNLEVQGSYSFTADDGKTYSVAYVADEHGFRAAGDHLPTPPPIPDDIAKSIEQNTEAEAQGLIEDGSYKEEYQHEHFEEHNFGGEFNQEQQQPSTFEQYQEVSKQISSAAPTQFTHKYPTKPYVEEQKPKVHYQLPEAANKQEHKHISYKKPKHYDFHQHKHHQFEPSHHQAINSHVVHQPQKSYEKFEHKIPEYKLEHHIPAQTFEFVPSDAKYHGHSVEHAGISESQFENHELGFNQDHHGLEQFASFENFKPFEHFSQHRQQHVQEPHPVFENEDQAFEPPQDGFAASENKPVTYSQTTIHGLEQRPPTAFEAQASEQDIPSIQTVDYYPVAHQLENQQRIFHQNPVSHQKINQQTIHPQLTNRERINQQRISQDQINQQRISQDQINQQRISPEQINQQRISQEQINQHRISQEHNNQQHLSQQQISQQPINQQQIIHPVQFHPISVPISHRHPEQKTPEHAYETSQHHTVISQSQKAPVYPGLKSKIRSQDTRGHKIHVHRHGALAYEGSQNVPVVSPHKPGPQRSVVKTHKPALKLRSKGPLVKVTKHKVSK